LPTKISVFAQDTRSQLEHKKLAINRLKGKLQSFELQKREQQLQETWFHNYNYKEETVSLMFFNQ
jgi:peptide chain release factor